MTKRTSDIEKCEFEKDGICYALLCYSNQKCGAKKKDGKIRYADIDSYIDSEKEYKEYMKWIEEKYRKKSFSKVNVTL